MNIEQEVNSILNDLAKIIINKYISRLEALDKVASGKSKDIKFNIQKDGAVYSIILSMQDYWKFIEYGVNGTLNNQGSPYSFRSKMVNVDAIKKWIDIKPIVPNTEHTAFAIATSIAQNGLKGYHILHDAIEDADNIIQDLMNDFYNLQVNKLVDEYVSNL